MEGKAEENKVSGVQFIFTNDDKKHLSPQEQSAFIRAFNNYDKNQDGTMDDSEFKNIMIDLGYRKITDADVTKMLGEQDHNKDGVLQWVEFVAMMVGMKEKSGDKFGNIVEGKFGAVAEIENAHGGKHSYSIEERTTFAKMINNVLKEDEDCKDKIPMNFEDDTLFHIFDNGLALCKLVMAINPDCLDSRALNRQQNMNIYQIKENLNMAIASCKGLGIKMVGIDSRDFIEKTPHLILATIWQLIKMYITSQITLKDCPEIMRLAEEGEELADLMKLAPDVILIRWVNYHLMKAGQTKRIKNLGKDLSDSFALMHVLHRLEPSKCSLDGIDDADLNVRAQKMITNSLAMGVPDVVEATHIVSGNTKVNTLFVSYIFNTKHGLEELTAEEYEAAGMIDDDIEGAKEERMFRMWVNSLGIEGVYVSNLIDECRDGVLLCKVLDKISPGCIPWKSVKDPPKTDFDRNINNNTAITACKDLKLKLIGIGGTDITKGTRKLVLAVIWQIVRLHYLKLIGDKTEDDIVKWANQLTAGKCEPIKNLKDKSMGSGVFMINIAAGIEPRAVNWDIVTPGESEEDQKMNAKYAISLARKLDAVIFCVWEDMVNVNPKQMLIYFSTMMDIHQDRVANMNK